MLSFAFAIAGRPERHSRRWAFPAKWACLAKTLPVSTQRPSFHPRSPAEHSPIKTGFTSPNGASATDTSFHAFRRVNSGGLFCFAGKGRLVRLARTDAFDRLSAWGKAASRWAIGSCFCAREPGRENDGVSPWWLVIGNWRPAIVNHFQGAMTQ
jgi:hypothetical protein